MRRETRRREKKKNGKGQISLSAPTLRLAIYLKSNHKEISSSIENMGIFRTVLLRDNISS